MSSMCMYQGLGQMLTMCLQHNQGCSETPKCAYVIYGQPLTARLFCQSGMELCHHMLLYQLRCVSEVHPMTIRYTDQYKHLDLGPTCPQLRCIPPLSTGSLYPKFRGQSSGIIQKLYETKTNTNTG